MKPLCKSLIYFYDKIQEIIFPPCCLLCGKTVPTIWCKECQKELYEEAIFKIEKKQEQEFNFTKHIYLFLYKNKIRNLILDYKFNNQSYLYKIFAKMIIKNKKVRAILENYDIIIPVPIHTRRKAQRGYNQSELIAKEIASQIKTIKYEGHVLKKVRHTIPQSSLTREQRKQNVQKVYKIMQQEKIKNKNIVLLDDIYTTGNTAKACAKILKENGANKIIVLTIAKD